MAQTVERVAGVGGELALRRDGEHFEIISNGTFLMDTRSSESERLLVRAALDALAAAGGRPRPYHLLVGGLGVGFSLAEAVRADAVAGVVVVEREPALLAWHETHLARFSSGALRAPGVQIVRDDLLAWLRARDEDAEPFDAVVVDVDNGPDWTVNAGNAALYREEGLALLAGCVAPAGALAVWSAHDSPEFEQRLGEWFTGVQTVHVPVARGEPDVVFLARGHGAPSEPSGGREPGGSSERGGPTG